MIGEPPYAEMKGDRPGAQFGPSLAFKGGGQSALLRRLRAVGIPTITVFLSGRPLYTSPDPEASDPKSGSWLIVFWGRIGGICQYGDAKAKYPCSPAG
jgi:beta-glucosidase